jgi:pyruvate dehydrogenase E1 component beta subunit
MSPGFRRTTYGQAIREGHAYLLERHPEVFVIGQGLWSPWYVGNSMTDLDVEFGRDRVIDSPVSELACTGAAAGAATVGKRPIVVHPRMDFMVLAADAMVTQAAYWSSMFGGRVRAPLVVRGIINRGGEQGAQHSQALHSWFAHVPGLRVAMPASVVDARDLLVSATLCDDPVLYVDDRWLYDLEGEIPDAVDHDALFRGASLVRGGEDVTLAGAGYSVSLALAAADRLAGLGVSAAVVDLRVLNPLDVSPVVKSVAHTGRLVAVDGGWTTCGLAGEIIAAAVERVDPAALKARPRRITLADFPAPSSGALERLYYPSAETIVKAVQEMV